MKETITIEKIGRSVGIRFDPVILDQLDLDHKDQVKLTILEIIKGSEDLKQIKSQLIFYGQLIKSGNSLAVTIKKKRLEVLDINVGDVFNVDIEKIS
ncbi:MAG: hypothetical protein KJI71_00385 [Patescibacteria group bacterium]|nr:hypothetical protein [Patescibacteria group bacterium]